MRFLFITKEYPPTPDPSGQIVCTIAEQLKKQGHYVDIIARDKFFHITEQENGSVFWLKISAWEKLSKQVKEPMCPRRTKTVYKLATWTRKVALALKIFKFPNVEQKLTRNTVKLYTKKLSNNNYDVVVGFFRPYSCLEAAVTITKKSSNAKCVACYLDLVEDKSCPSFMPLKLYKKLIAKGERYIFEQCDNIMLPKASKKSPSPVHNQYAEKLVYYEFPTFICPSTEDIADITNKTIETKETIKFLFAGTLSKTNRNPLKLLNLLNDVAKRNEQTIFQLDVFGGGDCFDLMNNYLRVDNFIVNIHGKVPKAAMKNHEQNSDFLINIMNRYSTLVPSKIFELFATGKPIINIMTNSDDGSMEYFDKYPAAHTSAVNEDDSILLAERFIYTHLNFKADMELIKNKYTTCTPEYVTRQILDLASGKQAGNIKGG